MNEQDYNRLVPLRTYLDTPQAQMLKTYLDAQGIMVFLNAEHVSAMNEGLKTDILIREIDKVRAEAALKDIEVLSCHQRHKLQDGEALDDEPPSCRQCGAMDIHAFEGEVPTFIPGIRIATHAEDVWVHCHQCDSYYREGKRRFSSVSVAFMWAVTLGAAALSIYWLITWIRWL
ncbi:DUF2007 domain-containing protein [Kordiimonas sp. SCSIO 12610]|uniref:DUF2007 domain-containing protein n=1 Tax=Kordiimonas sp. SCSIO 12610 TaxID=2829597 RepID=UPI00210A0BAC|nr:DUF2007 domain-containing protein [Kordiimonas sp. SCSIO 12610]UTW54926.1 hypothetical protein KFF44_14130 [Kordiimonas sp. SCSIO 12610]